MDTNLNELAKQVFKANTDKGFYDEINELAKVISSQSPHLLQALDNLITAQRLALITSETSETLEADRKGVTVDSLIPMELPTYLVGLKGEMFEQSDEDFTKDFENYVKDTEEDEVADQFIRLLDYVGMKNIDIDFHIKAKLKYNSLRPHKHGKNY